MQCRGCQEEMALAEVWECGEQKHCWNLYACDGCGAVCRENVWDDKGEVWVFTGNSVAHVTEGNPKGEWRHASSAWLDCVECGTRTTGRTRFEFEGEAVCLECAPARWAVYVREVIERIKVENDHWEEIGKMMQGGEA